MKRVSSSGPHGWGLPLLRGTIVGLAMLCGGAGWAAGAYISDSIPVTLRRGAGTEYRILKSLSGGARVEILEAGESYLKVRTADGTEGYILKQFVTDREPHARVAARLQRQQTALRQQLDELAEKNRDLQASQEQTRTLLQKTEAELKEVQADYATLRQGAQNVAETMADHDRLLKENQAQAQTIATLKQENRYLWRNNILRWFFAGVGVLFFGWILGRRPPRRTRSF